MLGEKDYHLNEQFHHIIWLGDFSFPVVDTTNNSSNGGGGEELPLDRALSLLGDTRNQRKLFDNHDSLNMERRSQMVFYGYREASPFPNFYPSYKRIENHPPLSYNESVDDFSTANNSSSGGKTHFSSLYLTNVSTLDSLLALLPASWLRECYRTSVKESIFKGGRVKEIVPRFADRILFYSMADLVEDLVPEIVSNEMYLVQENGGANKTPSKFVCYCLLQTSSHQWFVFEL
jgi:hypothetical protein